MVKEQSRLLKAVETGFTRFEYVPEARTTFDTFFFEVSKETGKSFPFAVNWKTNGTTLYTKLTDSSFDNVIVQVPKNYNNN